MDKKDMGKCLLSVIVPVYNIKGYIGACICSLCRQGFSTDEYEILCVDDGSTDGSGEVVMAMSLEHPQVKLVRQSNQGVSAARNTGIEHAQGTYLIFCDGDDFFEPYCLKKAVMLCQEHNAISASFGFKTVPEETQVRDAAECDLPLSWESGRSKPFYSGNIWRFIFSRDFINRNNIRFKAGMKYAEDELFLYHVCRFLDFKEHIYIRETFYNYRLRATSAVHRKREEKLKDHYVDMVEMAREYKSCLEGNTLSQMMRADTKNRFKYAVSNALQDALIIAERKPGEVLAELREKGLYPFGFMMELLKPKALKTTVVNYMKFFYSVPLYYICVYKLRQMMKR